MSLFSNILSGINLGSNWLLILVFLGIGLGYGMAIGKNRLNFITIATYFSLVINKAIPWKALGFLGIKSIPEASVQIFLFLAIVLAIFFLAPHSGLTSAIRLSGRGRASWWQLLILGTLQLGLLISIVASFLPEETVADVNPLLKQFFTTEEAKFLWLLLPMIGMLILRRRKIYGSEE